MSIALAQKIKEFDATLAQLKKLVPQVETLAADVKQLRADLEKATAKKPPGRPRKDG